MNCSEIRQELLRHLAGELTNESARNAEKHMAGCPACRAEFATLNKITSLLPQTPKRPEAYWEQYTETVLQKIRDGSENRFFWPRLVPATALSFAVAVLGVFHWSDYRKQTDEIVANLDILENLDVLEKLDARDLDGKI